MTGWTDLRHGIRMAAKNPAFTFAAVAVLALGIAANMVVFTLVNGILLRELPFDAPDRIVDITVFNRDNARNPISSASYPDVRDWNQLTRTFEGIAGADERTMNLSDDTRPAERFRGAFVSATAFSLIGQRPLLGRDFRAEDDREGAAPVVILGHAVWQRRYQGDPAIVGRTDPRQRRALHRHRRHARGLRLSAGLQRVAASRAAAAGDAHGSARPQHRHVRAAAAGREPRAGERRPGIGDGRAGGTASREQPQPRAARARRSAAAWAAPCGRWWRPCRARSRSCCSSPARTWRTCCCRARRAAPAKCRCACRSAPAAGRSCASCSAKAWSWPLIAGVLALGLSVLGIKAFWSVAADTEPPYWLQFPFDVTVFGYLAAVCLGTTIVFGLLPALHTSRTSLVELLNDAARGATGQRGRRWSGILVVGQIALTLVLLAGAGATCAASSPPARSRPVWIRPACCGCGSTCRLPSTTSPNSAARSTRSSTTGWRPQG